VESKYAAILFGQLCVGSSCLVSVFAFDLVWLVVVVELCSQFSNNHQPNKIEEDHHSPLLHC
jgi:hypothetical protein